MIRALAIAGLVFGAAQMTACGSSSGGSRDGSASSGDSAGERTDGDAADPAACTQPLPADAGVASLDDLPIAQLCAAHVGNGVIRWDDACQGSIIVVQSVGVDCAKYWLFDATTKALQATAEGCNAGARCTGGVSGFAFPSTCFDGNFPTTVTRLCPSDQTDASADSDAADGGVACGANLRCDPDQVCARPSCGGPPAACTSLQDGGTCSAGWSYMAFCPNLGHAGCAPPPCTPPPPTCVTIPAACNGTPTCACLPASACGGTSSCTSVSDGQVVCVSA